MTNLWRALRQFFWPYRFRFALSGFCALMVGMLWAANISAVFPVVKVLFEKQSLHDWVDNEMQQLDTNADDVKTQAFLWAAPLIKQYAPADPFLAIQSLLLFLMLLVLVKGVLLFLQEWLVAGVTQGSLFDLRNCFYAQTLDLDLAHFTKDGTADLVARFTYDMDSLASGVKTLLGKAVREPIKAASCLVLACMINWRLTLLSAVLAPLAGWLMLTLGRLIKRATRRSMESMSRIYHILQETFAGIKTVKAFTMEMQERQRFYAEAKRYRRHAMRIAKLEGFSGPMTEFMGVGLIVVALWAGAYLLLGSEKGTHLFGIRLASQPMSTGSLITLYALLAGISDPARKLSNVYSRLQRAAAAADRIFAFMDRRPQIVSNSNGRTLTRHRKSLQFVGVQFEYESAKPVLHGIDLKIPFGDSVALVGPNGCGKSTLANLVLRFYDPTEGTLQLDGCDLRELPLEQYRRQVGIVTQETVLFDDTVYNNITYGCRDADPAQVFAAARRAHADRFIERLPAGYQTRVGEKGMLLSGGQRQRIALARAILRDPAIFILDEATSALDLESEHLIHQALEEFISSRTTIIITHRLSTLALAKRILVMDAGQIVANGTHKELVESCSLYRRLHELQFQQDGSTSDMLTSPLLPTASDPAFPPVPHHTLQKKTV